MAETEYVPPSRRSGGRLGKASVEQLQSQVLHHLEAGLTVRDAMAKVDRQMATYTQWRKRYPGFANKVDRLRARQAGKVEAERLDFGTFREKYLGMRTHAHQWQWVDVLEGREPREMHPDQAWIHGRPTRILINTPPNHGKTVTITMDYVVYRICMDPNVKIIIISESRDMARKMLQGIKDRLTHPKYEDMHTAYGPAGGFKVGAASWTQNMIYVGNRDSAEKDPTVEVLGVGSQIYGARADLIIMDDCVTLKTSRTTGQRDKLLQFIDQEVSSRLEPKTGKLLLVGTRVSSNDLYAQILRRDAEHPKYRVWTYLSQPAVLEMADDPDEWVTLWPERWPGGELFARMHEIDQTTWNLVYQQQQVAEDAVFPEAAVDGCCYLGTVGPLQESTRPGGMQGLYVVAGLDPAAAGYTAMVVIGLDKRTKVRWVLDVINDRACTPFRMREHIKRLTTRYGVKEWRIEKNALQTLISQDPEIRQFVLQAGGKVVEHQTTGQNKWDPQFGVQSLAPLFLGALDSPPHPLVQIPRNGTHKGVKALIDQLITFDPEGGAGRTDALMAFWFADLACRKALEVGSGSQFVQNRWLTDGQRQARRVVNIDQYLAARAAV